MLAFWGGQFLVSFIVLGVMIANGDIDLANADTADIDIGVWGISLALFANVLAFAGIPYLVTRRKGLGSLARDFGLSFKWVDIPLGVAGGITALVAGGVLGTVVDNALGAEEPTSNIPIESVDGWPPFLLLLFGVGVVTPVIEELFFRGLFLRSGLKRGWSVAATVIATTFIFTLPHLAGVPEWPGVITVTVVIAVFGVILALLTIWTKLRLGAAIIAHLCINATGVIIEFWPG